jgi:hypothetical protein
MNVVWGVLMAAIGLFMFVCATLRSEFIIYRLMVYRAKILWGENAHRFLQVVGAIIIVVGVLWAAGVIW